MFTGIVTAVGTVRQAATTKSGLTLRIGAPYKGLKKGESIAVDGACLTVETSGKGWFQVHVVSTSIERTIFGEFVKGRKVNLERALKAGDRLGGHLVQGHVDGVGEVVNTAQHGDAWLIDALLAARPRATGH
jgi:riboflavin synthase